MKPANNILLEIREDALLIANTGQPFDRHGVVSICASHLGTKLDFKPYVPDSGCSDSDLINKIKEQELRTYKNDPNRIFSDYNFKEKTFYPLPWGKSVHARKVKTMV